MHSTPFPPALRSVCSKISCPSYHTIEEVSLCLAVANSPNKCLVLLFCNSIISGLGTLSTLDMESSGRIVYGLVVVADVPKDLDLRLTRYITCQAAYIGTMLCQFLWDKGGTLATPRFIVFFLLFPVDATVFSRRPSLTKIIFATFQINLQRFLPSQLGLKRIRDLVFSFPSRVSSTLLRRECRSPVSWQPCRYNQHTCERASGELTEAPRRAGKCENR